MKVQGRSMEPTLMPGDYVITKKARSLRPGFVIIMTHAKYGRIIKRITKISDQGISLSGENPHSTSAFDLGTVKAQDIKMRAILAITPKGLRKL